ncbi:tetraspanin family domain-containing protein [Ditylenchus destructor]|uniref:Tetraspanin family domain-containing protein n=1 Tax=Ditylenchus destructor TaxID=166010 RepID=A0AAD4NC65_9BILA|nr:tetraspanin family domain-containing protein [Ditylenchus destructor]
MPTRWRKFLSITFPQIIGVAICALGIYLFTKESASTNDTENQYKGLHWADILLNPTALLLLIGSSTCLVTFFGLFGALRDNSFLLKTYGLCVFLAYIFLVISTFVLFMLFYSDTAEGISAHSVLLYSIKNYHMNRNIAEFVDYLQEEMECCGTSSTAQGFRDWQFNEQFTCNQTNPYPEKCGVPFSCCRKSVVSETPGASNQILLPAMRSPQWSLQCWQNAQTKKDQELEADIYTRGCLQPLRLLFEKYAVHLGALVAMVILPVSLGVCLTQCLARQIDYQRYLLEREAKRYERRKRREQRYLERRAAGNQSTGNSPPKKISSASSEAHLAEQGMARAVQNTRRISNVAPSLRPPPNFPPPPTPKDIEDNAMKAAIAASKKEWKQEERRRQRRAVSSSPLRQIPATGATNSGCTQAHTLDPVRGKKDQRTRRRRRRAASAAVTQGAESRGTAGDSRNMLFLQQSDFTGNKKNVTG